MEDPTYWVGGCLPAGLAVPHGGNWNPARVRPSDNRLLRQYFQVFHTESRFSLGFIRLYRAPNWEKGGFQIDPKEYQVFSLSYELGEDRLKKVDIEEAINKKYPEWVVMVVTTDEHDIPNTMPAGWCMFTSGDPRMMATSIGFQRYTHDLLENSNEFVLAYPSKDQKEDVLYCGNRSGANVEKFEETDLTPVEASFVEVPLIEDAVACFECEKKGTLDTGDHTVFAGEVVAAHVTEETEKIYTVEGWTEEGANGFKSISEIK